MLGRLEVVYVQLEIAYGHLITWVAVCMSIAVFQYCYLFLALVPIILHTYFIQADLFLSVCMRLLSEEATA